MPGDKHESDGLTNISISVTPQIFSTTSNSNIFCCEWLSNIFCQDGGKKRGGAVWKHPNKSHSASYSSNNHPQIRSSAYCNGYTTASQQPQTRSFQVKLFLKILFSIASVNVLCVKYLFFTKRTQQRQCEPVYSNHEQNSFVGFQFICKQIPLNENQKLQKYFRKCKCKMFLYWKIYISEMQIKLPFS